MFKDSCPLNDNYFYGCGWEGNETSRKPCLDKSEDHPLALKTGLRLILFKFWLTEYWQAIK